MNVVRMLVVAAVAAWLPACSFTDVAPDTAGLTDFNNRSIVHVNQVEVALNLLFTTPLVGDATLEATVKRMSEEAKLKGAKNIRIVQSDSTLLWWVFPPFSFIITPAIGNSAADGLK